jgi:hypothetical protein
VSRPGKHVLYFTHLTCFVASGATTRALSRRRHPHQAPRSTISSTAVPRSHQRAAQAVAAAACWRSCTSSHRHHRSALSPLKARLRDPLSPLVSHLLIYPFRPFCPDVPRRSAAFLLLLLRQPSPLLSSHCRFRWRLGRIACARDSGSIAVVAARVAFVHVEPQAHRAERTRPLISGAISCAELLCQRKVNTLIYALAQLELDALFTGYFHCIGPASRALLKSSF